jgi:diguanylate cyclase (GGDEF)-like protein
LALVLFDIDHFKLINDSHGHLAGDAVLKHLVLTVKQELRESDALCRVGGEEFALLFPNTAKSIALQTAELLRQAIANNPCDFDGARIPFTISAGVVEWIPSEGAAQFYKRADVQLYAAKHQGRNRVC